jgi:hypothetical protein
MTTAAALLTQAQAEGVAVVWSPPGALKLRGDPAAVARWAPLLRPHKPDLVEALAPRRLWLVTPGNGPAASLCCDPPATLAEVQARHPGALVEPVPEPPAGPPLAPDVARTLRGWLAGIGEDDPLTVAQVLERAQSDPEALAYYLDRAAPWAQAQAAAVTEAVTEARNEREAILTHLGKLPPHQARALADLAGAYYAHAWSCPTCRAGTLTGAKLHRPCPEGAALWDRYADAAGRRHHG